MSYCANKIVVIETHIEFFEGELLNRFHTLLLILGLSFLAACEGSNPSELLIGGGQPIESQATGVVRVAHKGKAICTGVLVASDLIITAAHCLKSDGPSAYSIIFPANTDDNLRAVTEFQRVRDDSLTFFPNFDLAWMKLVGDAPSPYAPATVLGDSAKIASGTGLTLVGVANETPCNPGDSVCKLVKLAVKLKNNWTSPHLVNLAVVDSQNPNDGSGTCPGDSGGPAFISRSGRDILFGIVAGKDPIFTGGVTTGCGSPSSVLTRIGEYQEWIEETSGRKIQVVEPTPAMLTLDFLGGSENSSGINYTSWSDWFSKLKPNDSAWVTVHKLLEQTVLLFGPKISDIPQLFQKGGEEWISQITALGSLTLGFPEQAVAIEDLRPLIALQNLSELTFLARAYKGMDVLSKLPRLQSLSIVGRVSVQAEQGQFAWNLLASKSIQSLRLSQLPPAQLKNINWTNLPALNTLVITSPLGRIPTSFLNEENLQALENLQIQELSCDQGQWPKVAMPNLRMLTLRSSGSLAETEISCINWERLPNLTELSIQGYRIDIANFTANMPPNLATLLKSSSR